MKKMAFAAISTLVLALGAAACGGDSDSSAGDGDGKVVIPPDVGDGRDPAAQAAGPPIQLAPDPDSRAAVAVVKRFYKAMRDGDAAAACSTLSRAQRREAYPGESCESTYEDILAEERKRPGFRKRWTEKPTYSASAPPNAFVRVRLGGKDEVGLGLVEQRKQWKLGPK